MHIYASPNFRNAGSDLYDPRNASPVADMLEERDSLCAFSLREIIRASIQPALP